MYFRLIFGIILLLFSCKEPTVLPSDKDTHIIVEFDTSPPGIKWISPHFDAVLEGITVIQCQIEDSSEIDSEILYVDDSLYTVGTNLGNTFYEFTWNTTSYEDGSEHTLYVMAVDKAGNDTTTQRILVKIDNSNLFPSPVNLLRITELFELDTTIIIDTTMIDSIEIIIDSTFSGYEITWDPNRGSGYKYILERSQTSLMESSTELFSTTSDSNYIDNMVSIQNDSWYYRMIIEDHFGYRTPGNVLSTSMDAMPPQWEIKSVIYNTNQLIISWNNIFYEDYSFHQVLVSNNRRGTFTPIIENETIVDLTKGSYEIYDFDYSLRQYNWFALITADTSGKKSISPSYKHPVPKAPVIDSVLYNNNSFRIQWAIDTDEDFDNYQILSSEDEDPFMLSVVQQISNQTEDTLYHNINESEYYLFQVITTDAWGLNTRGPVIAASSFYKFSIIEDNGSSDVLYSVIANNEGKYISIGESNQSGSWFMQVNGYGEVEISKNIVGSTSLFRSITRSTDGGYFITGFSIDNQDENLSVEKIDVNGNSEWSKSFESEYKDGGNAIISLSDGNIGVTGYSYINTLNQDILVMKISADDGSEIWSTTIGGDERDVGHDILPSDNGGMYILGETHSQGDYDGDIWILEVDTDGELVDTLLISIPNKQVGYSFVQTENGGFTIAGITSGSSSVTDALMINLNEMGEVSWVFSYGGVYNDIGYSLIYSDGGWVLAGQTYSYDLDGGDALLLKVNEMGDFQWMQTYGGENNDSAFDIDVAKDGGFIICGSTFIPGNHSDGWLIKTDSRGNYKDKLSYP